LKNKIELNWKYSRIEGDFISYISDLVISLIPVETEIGAWLLLIHKIHEIKPEYCSFLKKNREAKKFLYSWLNNYFNQKVRLG
jgi:hypothetical protein